MPDQNTYTPHYSLADIEQYLQGKMTAAEMYALEKAALQDPFLADALEGYTTASLPEAHEHLQEVQEWLLPGKKEAKVVPLATTGNRWWRVAAALILLLGAGIITWLLVPNGNGKQEVAKITKPAPVHPPIVRDSINTTLSMQNSVAASANSEGAVNSNYLKADTVLSSALTSSTWAKPNSLPSKQKVTVRMDTLTYNYNYESANTLKKTAVTKQENNRMDLAGIELKRQQMTDSTRVAFKDNNLSADKNQAAYNAVIFPMNVSVNHLQGRITNQQGKGVAGASVNIIHGNRNTVTDANGYFSLPSTDTVAQVLVNSVGYMPQESMVKNNASNSIMLQENTTALNEVAVIGYGAAKKRNQAGALPVESKIAFVKMDTLMPEGGWDKFKAYVAYTVLGEDNLDDIKNIEFHGELEFEFRVDDDGKVKDVTILKSPDENKNTVIAEAVKQGPRWAIPDKKKKKKNKAIIHF